MGFIGSRGLMAMLILGLLPTPAARSAVAQDRPAAPSVALTNVGELRGQLGASINNAGAQLSFEASRRRPLFASRHPLLSEAHIGVGGSAAFTPAHARGGVWLEAAPVSVFVLRVGAEPAYYFGSFDSLTSFESRNDPFDTDSRRERQSAQSGTATRFYVTPRLQARAGRLIGVASADFEWWSSNAAGPFFYEPTRERLLDTSGDRVTTLTGAVLYEHALRKGRLTTGITHSRMRVDGGSLNQVNGRLFTLDRPSVTVSVSRYLDDPNKQNEWTAAMAIGFSLHR